MSISFVSRVAGPAIIYATKDSNDRKVFDAKEWLAAMCSHVPNRGEQMVRYYGWYSNVLRGKRQKETTEEVIPYRIESDISPKACKKSWARLIQNIYEADPLICPKCQGTMRIISSIEDQEVVKTILQYLGIWTIRSRPLQRPTHRHHANMSRMTLAILSPTMQPMAIPTTLGMPIYKTPKKWGHMEMSAQNGLKNPSRFNRITKIRIPLAKTQRNAVVASFLNTICCDKISWTYKTASRILNPRKCEFLSNIKKIVSRFLL